jgi:hypothetical protein
MRGSVGNRRRDPAGSLRPATRASLTPDATEILFIDPSASDIGTIFGSLRAGVEAILLHPARPASSEIAAGLAGREALEAVHVVAHGAPGRVSFGSDDWTVDSLEDQAEDLASIGQALGAGGELRLWSCNTARGAVGEAFMDGLARVAGAAVAGATAPVGQAALGGTWELAAHAGAAAPQPPITAGGMAIYGGVLAADEIVITGSIPNGNTTNIVRFYVVDTSSGTVVGQVVLPDAANEFHSVSIVVKVPRATNTYAVGTFDAGGNFQPSTLLRVASPSAGAGAVGASQTTKRGGVA